MRGFRIDWIVIAVAFFAMSCSGGGCGGCASMQPIPGGFVAAKRHPNAAQLRLATSALAKLEADPATLVGSLLGSGSGPVTFNIPGNCGADPQICCVNGMVTPTCGPLNVDLTKHPGDDARLVLAPQANASTLNVTVRMRLKTAQNIPIHETIACDVSIDTTQGSNPDVEIVIPISFAQDAMAGTTRVVPGTVAINRLESADINLSGSFACTIASFGVSFLLGTLTSTIATQIKNAITSQTCKKCPMGNVAECGSPFATACTNNVCEEGNQCLQELGLDGRMPASSLFAGFSPGTTGALDLYEVAGGYATTNNNGVALGLLGGMEPGGTPRDRCGPPATEPVTAAIPQSEFFQGNARPDTNVPFDVAIGVHKSQLAQFAFAGYDGGLLCLTIGHSTVSQLTTDTISLLSRSLGHLNADGAAPMAVGLRPQAPPTITLGKNTFMDDGMGMMKLTDPLLDINFKAMEIDFFAAVDEQYIRVFTVVADVDLPIGLQVSGMGQLVPVLGDVSHAFTNLTVKNSDAVTETPAQLAAAFPSILNLVLPQLSSGLPAVSLPAIGPLKLSVVGITSVPTTHGGPDNDFLAIFANLVTATPNRPVHTTVEIARVDEPTEQMYRDPTQWAGAPPPSVTLSLGGSAPDLEWSIRIDDGLWSAWTKSARPTIASRTFWLTGIHKVEVRAREIDQPDTIDETPVVIEVPFGPATVSVRTGKGGEAGFHGTAGAAGCACATGGSSRDAAPFAIAIGMLLFPVRLRRAARNVVRRAKRLGGVVIATAIACLPGCDCGGSKPCGDIACMPGDLAHGGLGRWTSIAGDENRVLVATYDEGLGDLVVADATNPATLVFTAVDGIPAGAAPTYDPSTYRGGIEDVGPNVGAWTSIALANHTGEVAYQDRDGKALKFALESAPGTWSSYVVDSPNAEEDIGSFASLAIDGSGHPAIAYLAIGVDDGMGHRNTELRLARAGVATPAMSDWTTSSIAVAAGTCAGLCGTGTTCAAPVTAGDPQSCVAATSDCTTACSTTQVCHAAACLTAVADSALLDIPTGTGLFASLVAMPDGRLAVAYYDRTKRALVLAVESAANSNTFTEVTLDTVTPGDRGMWATAAVDGSGTIHVAYQEALGDQLMYTTWNGTPGVPEIVDDGQRTGDRTHPVGAAANLFLVNGTPSVAYQDGLLADLVVASKAGASWQQFAVATGPLLDGFSIAVTTAHGGQTYIAWDQLDPSQSPPNALVVKTQ